MHLDKEKDLTGFQNLSGLYAEIETKSAMSFKDIADLSLIRILLTVFTIPKTTLFFILSGLYIPAIEPGLNL
ncbi:MAG: hypothetical protein EA391_14065 [Balneolaceae bacterium]|nr:MAG: hypothetical protein EA391_14065 [Balneolaceae bacterium]